MNLDSAPSLIGDILERKPAAKASAPSPSSNSKTGFPLAQHRSKSAFARAREAQNTQPRKHQGVPVVQGLVNHETTDHSDSVRSSVKVAPEDDANWREQSSRENEERLQAMSEEERQQETTEILEKFGGNVAEILLRARKAREGRKDKDCSALSYVSSVSSLNVMPINPRSLSDVI